MSAQEFRSEEPTVDQYWKTTGAKVPAAGTYLCTNCRDALNSLRTYMEVNEELPACPTCGPDARWERCGPGILHCD